MKIAVEITIFGCRFSEVVDFPGEPRTQAEVVQWMMSQTDFKWTGYDTAPVEDRIMYNLQEGATN